MILRRSGTRFFDFRLALAAAMPVMGIMVWLKPLILSQQVGTGEGGAGAQTGHAVDLGEGAQDDDILVGRHQVAALNGAPAMCV